VSATRRVCKECGWQGTTTEVLEGKSPFDNAVLDGCPLCFAVNSMRTTCDEPDCWEPDTMGTPTPDGYRRTCWDHRPMEPKP
jgi:hypothetical protein